MDKLGRGRGLGTEENVFPVTWPPLHTHTTNEHNQQTLSRQKLLLLLQAQMLPIATQCVVRTHTPKTHTHTYKYTRALTTQFIALFTASSTAWQAVCVCVACVIYVAARHTQTHAHINQIYPLAFPTRPRTQPRPNGAAAAAAATRVDTIQRIKVCIKVLYITHTPCCSFRLRHKHFTLLCSLLPLCDSSEIGALLCAAHFL